MGDMLYGFELGLSDGLFFRKDYFVPRVAAGERERNIAAAVLTQKGFEPKWVKYSNLFLTRRLRRNGLSSGFSMQMPPVLPRPWPGQTTGSSPTVDGICPETFMI